MSIQKIDIDTVRNSVGNHIGRRVRIKMNRGRHKIDITEGILKEAYPSIFIVEVDKETDGSKRKVSFSYTDILTKDIQMLLCKAS